MKVWVEGMPCEVEDCTRPATGLVYSRERGEVIACCEPCEDVIQDEQYPEYWVHCSNCGCGLPIN